MREALNAFVIRGISQQHPVPGGAAGAPEVRRRRLQHRLHRRALRAGLPRRRRAARRPADFLVALAAVVRPQGCRERAAGISGQLPGHGVQDRRRRSSSWCASRRRTTAPRRCASQARRRRSTVDARVGSAATRSAATGPLRRHPRSTAPATASRSPRRSSAAARASAGIRVAHNGLQHRRAGAVCRAPPSCCADAATRRRPT